MEVEMTTNQALQVNHSAQGAIALCEVGEPEPAPSQVVVQVVHASANFGELRFASVLPEGTTLGYDAAGFVTHAAADGSGPAVGSRVVAFGPGAWAQRAAFATDSVAAVPDSVGLMCAAAVPMVGLTALRTLRAIGPLLGKRILITGASGGVGRAAIQLGALGGASVTAVVGSAESGKGLADLGADRVLTSLDEVEGTVDAVLETVGGPSLLGAWNLLAPGGNLQSIGWASGQPAELPVNAFFSHGAARTISSFGDMASPGADLTYLMSLLETGRLSAEIGWQGPWTEVASAANALFERRVPGKIVLDLPRP